MRAHILSKPQQTFAAVQTQWLAKSGSHAQSNFLYFKPLDAYMHILEAGAGEPLLMLHGGNSFSALWEPLLAQLASHYHLIAPDRFSCGLSDPTNYKKLDLLQHAIDYMDALFDHYGYTSINVVGNSLGGYWAMLYALQKPERINKIILIGVPGGTQAPPKILRLASIPYFNQLLFFILMNKPHATEDLFKRALVADIHHLPKDIFKLMHMGLRLPGAQKAWLDILEMTCTLEDIKPQYCLFKQLPEISQKTLLLWGDSDVFGSKAQARVVADAMPRSTLNIIPNAGHMPWLDQGTLCAQLIRDFCG